ncbi:hypothetical protein CHUAL_003952 [Chamberlinius hualienensis]
MGKSISDHRQLNSVFNTLTYLLLLVGIDKLHYTGENKPSCLRRLICMTIKIVYCIFAVFFMLIIFVHTCFLKEDLKIIDLSFMLSGVISTGNVLILYAIFVFRKEKLTKCLRKLILASEKIIKNENKVFRLFLWGCCACIVFFIFIIIISLLVKQPNDNQTASLNNIYIIIKNTPIYPANHTNAQLWNRIELCLISLGSFSVMVCNCFFQIFYVFVAKLIWVNFDLLNKHHSSLADYEVVKKNQNIKNYRLLCEIVDLFEEIFTEIAAIWSFTEILGLVIMLRIMEIKSLTSLQNSVTHEAFVSIAVTSVAMIAKAYIAAGINDKVRTSIWLLKDFKLSSLDDNTKSKIQIITDLYRFYIQVDPPTLTGWKLYDIKKSYILNTFASVLTYVLVLYNIHDIKAEE